MRKGNTTGIKTSYIVINDNVKNVHKVKKKKYGYLKVTGFKIGRKKLIVTWPVSDDIKRTVWRLVHNFPSLQDNKQL